MHRSQRRDGRSGARGFALAEVLIAVSIVVTLAAGVLPLFVTTHGALEEAHAHTMSVVLARSKLDQLQSLTWGYRVDADGNLSPVTDTTTDLASDPPSQAGQGLRLSPSGCLWNNSAGYADFEDDSGAWVGSGLSPPRAARYVRRWAVATLPGDAETLVLQVRVLPVGGPSGPAIAGQTSPLRGETWLVGLRTRTRP
jgi:type II secretory pathway pseudopilin PulG